MRTNSYAIDSTGIYTHFTSPLLEGWEKTELPNYIKNYVKDAPEKISVGVKWKGTKLPAAIMSQVLGTIRQYPHRETGYVLYYRLSDKSWRVECPEQNGTRGRVEFTGKPVIEGYAEIGTIHTHPEMMADWSSTDMHDQEHKFGLHMVVGTKDGYADKIKCTVFTANGHYDQDLWDVVESIDFHKDHEPRKDWLDTLSKPVPVQQPQANHGVFPMSTGMRNISFDSYDPDEFDYFGEMAGWTRHGGQARGMPISMLGFSHDMEQVKKKAYDNGYWDGYRKATEAVVGNVMGSLVKLDDSTMPATVDSSRIAFIRDFLDEYGVQTVDLSPKADATATYKQLELMMARLVQWIRTQDDSENVNVGKPGRAPKPKRLRTAIFGLFKKLVGKRGC